MPSPKTNQPNRPQKSKFWALVELLFQGLWKHRLLYLALILLVMCSTSFVMYHLKARTAKMMIALNYEEATRGLYPNNTRFNISLIKSDDVLDRAIAKAGLEGQVTAQDMAENITAWASNVNGMQLPSDTTSYKIATTYTITYEKNDEIGPRISARDMLSLIVESYKEVFYEDYTYVEMGISPDWSECDKQEYMEIGSFFDKECQKLHRFLNTNAKENGTFRSELTGETFTSLRQKVDNFTSIDLEKYDSYVLQSGLSKNRERYISKLEYQNFLKNISYQKLMAEYQNRLHTIEIYDSALTAVVLIPTLDTQNNFYMSRTKVCHRLPGLGSRERQRLRQRYDGHHPEKRIRHPPDECPDGQYAFQRCNRREHDPGYEAEAGEPYRNLPDPQQGIHPLQDQKLPDHQFRETFPGRRAEHQVDDPDRRRHVLCTLRLGPRQEQSHPR